MQKSNVRYAVVFAAMLWLMMVISYSSINGIILHRNYLYLGGNENEITAPKTSARAWTTTEVISTESDGDSRFSEVTIDDNNNIHVVWMDASNYAGSGTDWDIFYKYYNATSGTWSGTEVVSWESSGDSQYPTIAVDNESNVYVAWQDNTDYNGAGTDSDIFFKRK
ncbi:MAG: hypothetical protein ACP6IY_22230, partial [Promethearchaeia archaeon]